MVPRQGCTEGCTESKLDLRINMLAEFNSTSVDRKGSIPYSLAPENDQADRNHSGHFHFCPLFITNSIIFR